jgi:hypothetical protein
MRRVLAVTVMALLIGGSAIPVSAMDTNGQGPEAPPSAAPDGSPAAPAATDSDQGEAGVEPPETEAGANDGVMKNFTRHRPGACPEGPPCKVED